MLGGAFIVEVIFAIPGLGRMGVDAIFQKDFPVIQATLIAVALNVLLVNLLVDILYGYLDPRVRIQAMTKSLPTGLVGGVPLGKPGPRACCAPSPATGSAAVGLGRHRSVPCHRAVRATDPPYSPTSRISMPCWRRRRPRTGWAPTTSAAICSAGRCIGARVSLLFAIGSTALSAALGIVLGLFAGFRGGAVDAVIMRITDAFLYFPR